ncbi:mediator of rna polymerase ii transcription subunit 15a [Nicotiana attenuata]|uniref:Mediator of rna polymerase ii transcription subunit 15a n=1 Tax=Nicotiana attenuata TaxID=49451 RepID=A0A1J6IPB0_NICAT|nr:mediator of rna polymerase ii transcription subunit 15a [Nicotiana attenuata]
MREMYVPKLNDLYQKIAAKVQQHDSLPQRPQTEQIEKLKVFKMTLERVVVFLRLNKHDIQPSHKEKLLQVEKHISFFLNSNRPHKPTPTLQGQLPQPSMQLQQPQYLDGQGNPLMQHVQAEMIRQSCKHRRLRRGAVEEVSPVGSHDDCAEDDQKKLDEEQKD